MAADIPSPQTPLFRLGRAPDPLALTPWAFVGQGRFDDLRDPPEYRVLYAGERLACFYEMLSPFRVDLHGVAAQGVTREWLINRRVAAFTVLDPEARGCWLDLTAPATFSDFRVRFGRILAWLDYIDFDVIVATNDDRGLSQLIGLWSYHSRYQGIRYATHHHPGLSCWAVFESTPISLVGEAEHFTPADPDLQNVANSWNLPVL